MKIGFVSLIGKSNVGKSTILNLLVKKKVSIVTPKLQTTRNNIASLIQNHDYQIVISDTPGFHLAKNILGQSMNQNIIEAIKKSNLVILVISANDRINRDHFKFFLNKKIDFIVLNKIDLLNVLEIQVVKDKIHALFSDKEIIEVCGIDGFNIDGLLNTIISKLPDNSNQFLNFENDISLKDNAFYCKEIIRETIFLNLEKEIPYHTAVTIDNIVFKNDLVLINASIILNKYSQKIIVIGRNGKMLKKIRLNSQKQLKQYFNKKVLIDLFVRVKEDWFNSVSFLKELGY